MAVYSIAVCDDDREFAENMGEMCRETAEKLKDSHGISFTVAVYNSFDDVLREFANGRKIDLLFLDIMLGQKNGIELAKKLRERGYGCSVVLMTVEREFLLEGYSVQPVYFLLKPIDKAELEKAIKLDLNRLEKSMNVILKCDRKNVLIPVDDIIYIEGLDHDLTVHTRTKDYAARMTFDKMLDQLPKGRFVRCHNSYAINLARVTHFSRQEGIMLDNRAKVPIGRKYFDGFRKQFVEYIDGY